VLFIPLLLVGCSNDPDGGRSRRSPDAVFAALVIALEEKDFATVVACLDPDTVAKTAARGAWRGLQERYDVEAQWRQPRPEDNGWPGRWRPLSPQEQEEERKHEEKRRLRYEVLEKHGLTKEVADALRKQPDSDTARADLACRIPDPAGFLADFLSASETYRAEWLRENWPRPRLGRVTLDGNQAAGTFSFSRRMKGAPPVQELTWQISFVRVAERDWRVVGTSLLDFVGIPWHW
jgi:hypothetical protein